MAIGDKRGILWSRVIKLYGREIRRYNVSLERMKLLSQLIPTRLEIIRLCSNTDYIGWRKLNQSDIQMACEPFDLRLCTIPKFSGLTRVLPVLINQISA